MTLPELITRVKIKVDEYASTGATHSFDSYVSPMIQEAADELTDKAPKHLFTPTDIVTTGIVYNDDIAYIPAPAEFARLYDILFPLWKKPVYDVISVDHPLVEQQDNEYIRAGYGRPVVMVRTYKSGSVIGRYLACAKVLSGATPSYARSINYVTAASMPTILEEALTWLAASKILQLIEYPAQAKLAYDQHLAELQNKAR